MLIILIHQDYAYAKVLKTFLERNDHEVAEIHKTCTSFMDNYMKNVCPELLIIDLDMILMNGYSCGKTMNFKNPNLKMIAISKDISKASLEALISFGFKGFVEYHDVFNSILPTIESINIGEYNFNNLR